MGKAEYNKNMIIRKEKDAMILFSWSDFDQNICENSLTKKLSS